MTLSIEPQTVQEGERVVFTCQATANPEILGYRCEEQGMGHSGEGSAPGCGERLQALTPLPPPPPGVASSPRWAKGGFSIEDAHESHYETNVDYSFFTEPVSCEVYNKVGSTNVSTLVNVHCE